MLTPEMGFQRIAKYHLEAQALHMFTRIWRSYDVLELLDVCHDHDNLACENC